MRSRRELIRDALSNRFWTWLAISVGMVVVYYTALLLSMVFRFGNWPNYATFYNWPGNVVRIIESTPSLSDTISIIREEWLFEVGYMNMSFGHGISEWSLNLIPAKMLIIWALGILLATIWALNLERRRSCARSNTGFSVVAGGLGSGLVALTGATMSWVVCCATPSWIVGLAMLGVGVATANWLEPIGPWLSAAGFVLLTGTVFVLSRPETSSAVSPPKGSHAKAHSLLGSVGQDAWSR